MDYIEIDTAYKIETIKINFHCSLTRAGRIPAFVSFIIRGMLGKYLREEYCRDGQCMDPKNCPHCALFKPKSKDFAQQLEHMTENLPPPMIITTNSYNSRNVMVGDFFTFSIKLLGYGFPFFEELIDLARKIGKTGLGRDRITYKLEQITFNKGDGVEKKFVEGGERSVFSTKDIRDKIIDEVIVVLKTPLRLQENGKIVRRLTKEGFLKACLRRVDFLMSIHEKREYLHSLDEFLGEFTFEAIYEKWNRQHRYSASQKKEIPLGGILGAYSLQGNLTRILPILEFCEYVHIGKQTVFGLGEFKLFISY